MKLYDGGKIILGLAVFLALMLSPLIFGIGSTHTVPEPSIDTPVIQALAVKECVEPKEYMRTSHMVLLNQWRDQAVRDGDRTYVNSKGKKYNISLQNTCMNCHSNKKKFCDTCHGYVAVKPYCWGCHVEPRGGGA